MSARKFKQADESRALLERVQEHHLPEDSIELIDSYDEIVGDRDRFLWKWAHYLFPTFTLSCVAPEYFDRVQDDKLLGLMFVSILDDIAEKHQDQDTFEEAAKIPFDHQTVNFDRGGVDQDLLTFANETWAAFAPAVRDAPRAAEFQDIVRFDLKQVVNAMDYSNLANQNVDIVTESDLQTYDAHNMMMYGFADIDLVHSPAFDRSELSTLRRVIERAQRMVRIGNWITTWRRELSEGDFTSGIVVHALEHDIVSAEDLRASREGRKDVETIAETIQDHDLEDVFFTQWNRELATAREIAGDVDSVDVGAYLDGIETVMDYHLASRGLK